MDWIEQIIIGTVLGGSSIIKPSKGNNCYLNMRSKNYNWILYKIKELQDYGSRYEVNKKDNAFIWRSDTNELFTKIYSMLYDENKKRIVSIEILDSLRDIGLAIWFGDRGEIIDGQISLDISNLDRYGYIIRQYFNEIGLSCVLVKNKNTITRIYFTEEATKKFLMIVGEKLPFFMVDKIKEVEDEARN